jgi:folylpolyglutamate synthase/dihydropteroate synthase
MNYFRNIDVSNIAVEVGIGGARDITSVLNHFVENKTLLISRIEREHCGALGDSLYEIAVQKALLADKNTEKVVIHYHNRDN